MIREPGKAYKVAQKILKKEGVKVPKPKTIENLKQKVNYLTH